MAEADTTAATVLSRSRFWTVEKWGLFPFRQAYAFVFHHVGRLVPFVTDRGRYTAPAGVAVCPGRGGRRSAAGRRQRERDEAEGDSEQQQSGGLAVPGGMPVDRQPGVPGAAP